MISLLKSEKADANVLFIKIEIEHGIKKMSQTKMQKRFSNEALHMQITKKRLLH